jgi:TonB family protein
MRSNEYLTLGLLPEKKLDWRKFALSYGFVLFLLGCMLISGLIWTDRMSVWSKYTVTEIIPRPDLVPEKPVIKPRPKVAKLLPEMKFETPKVIVPREMPKPRVEEARIEPPKLQPVNFYAPKVAVSGAAQMPRVILTNQFGSSATPTVNAPREKVQTGGFGDPNGLPGEGKQGAKLTAAKLGSFDLPEGAGTGNGTGGAKGIKGTIASTGFGNGVAQGGNGDGRRSGQGVQASGFASQQVATTGHRNLEDNGPATVPVEIVFKPKPTYTEEARKLQLEGEVLLEVKFGADGALCVNRVVRGLGHGLDEAAVSAANKIKFKPAQRNGSVVDSTAIVHVMFQLAS